MFDFIKKLFTKKDKNDQHCCNCDCGEDEPEASIVLYIKGDSLSAGVEWSEAMDPQVIAGILASISTGEIFPVVLEAAEEFCNEIGEEELLDFFLETINDHQENLDNQDDEENPLIQPLNGIKHQIHMYHSTGEEEGN